MKKIIIALFASLMLSSFLFSESPTRPETGGPDPRPQKPGEGGQKPEVGRPAPKPHFPLHWGRPPALQTKDIRPLPGGFGMGSSTLANWIKENMEEDKANGRGPGGQGKPEKPEVLTDKEKLDPRKSEGEVLKQVKEGKISQEDAREKLDALRGEMEKRGEFKRPKRPKKPELSEDVKGKLKDLKELQDGLAKKMKTKMRWFVEMSEN